MELKELSGDIFRTQSKAIVHCISADCALGMGIAKTLDGKFGIRQELHDRYGAFGDKEEIEEGHKIGVSTFTEIWVSGKRGFCVETGKDPLVYNLVTKWMRYDKPTPETIQNALVSMKGLIDIQNRLREEKVNVIAMPHIACGLDKMKWEVVREIIKDVFKDTNIIIEAYDGKER